MNVHLYLCIPINIPVSLSFSLPLREGHNLPIILSVINSGSTFPGCFLAFYISCSHHAFPFPLAIFLLSIHSLLVTRPAFHLDYATDFSFFLFLLFLYLFICSSSSSFSSSSSSSFFTDAPTAKFITIPIITALAVFILVRPDKHVSARRDIQTCQTYLNHMQIQYISPGRPRPLSGVSSRWRGGDHDNTCHIDSPRRHQSSRNRGTLRSDVEWLQMEESTLCSFGFFISVWFLFHYFGPVLCVFSLFERERERRRKKEK